MAKLPDSTVLGGIDPLNSRRPIASYDDSGIAKGDAIAAEAIGSGVEKLGKGAVAFGSDLADVEVRKQTAERTQARAEALSAKVELDSQFAKDTKYQDMPERYKQQLDVVTQDAGRLISTPGNRQRFVDEFKPTAAHGVASITAHARNLEADTNVGYTLEMGPKLQNAALAAPDEATRGQAIQAYNDQVDSLVMRGYRTQTQALAMKQDFAHQYAVASTAQKIDTDPQAVVDDLSNPAGKVYEFMKPADREQLLRQARQGVLQQKTKEAYKWGEFYERQIIDYGAGITPLPDRRTIETDVNLDEPRRNALLRQHDQANAAALAYQQFAAKFASPDGTFNPYDKNDQAGVDKTYQILGGGLPALQTIVDRTNIIPKAAVTDMRGALVSGDVKRVSTALQLASNLNQRNPTILSSNVQGSKDIEDAVTTFEHNINDLGMTAEQAAQRHIESLTPEYQAKVQARIKSEDIKEVVKKNLSINDLTGKKGFSVSWAQAIGEALQADFTNLTSDPKVGFGPAERKAMYGDYEELFREYYGENGNVDTSKALAVAQLKKTWGVTRVSGAGVVMRYPPEKAPAYFGIENAGDQFADQAVAAIKADSGQDVPRDKLMVSPIPGGRTSQPYWNGMPPPYLVSWFDEKGVMHSLAPGKGFVADPKAMQDAQTAKRKEAFDARRNLHPGFEIGSE